MSDSWHSYPKIYALGHSAISALLDGPVVIEEKIDGSQFSFGRFNGELRVRSKGCVMLPDAPEKMFSVGVEAISTLDLRDGWTYRGEYLQKPKHNTLSYSRIPEKHVMIFDVNTGHECYLGHKEKALEAARLGLETVPVLHYGSLDGMSSFQELLDRESVLGGPKIEGVVIKNYARFCTDGKAMMGKFVSEAFKELHGTEWKATNPSKSDVVTLLIDSLRTDARFEKAVQHLRESGKLEETPRDIGALIKEVHLDIESECTDIIARKLTEWALPQIKRGVAHGMPEWYKTKLAEKQFA